MTQAAITIGGIPLPSEEPLFLAILAIHVAAGLSCVITGLVAMLSERRPGRHPRYGTYYYWGLGLVFVTMAALAAMRWAEDYHLFILGMLSFAAAFVGRQVAPSRMVGRVRIHIAAMALSYVLLLTAFYVDNGKNLPLWRSLPPTAYWLIPFLVGMPLTIWAMVRHPLAKLERRDAQAKGAA
ncbi:MAG: hypothetical protein U0132_13435 [Gemmatimonadaceae bacterium]